MVTDRNYTPTPVQSWAEIIAKKDEEIATLKRKIEVLECVVYAYERQAHVDMSR